MPGARAAALAAVATHLAGTPVALPISHAAEGSMLRLCLALAYTTGDGTAPDENAARMLVRVTLAGEAWAQVIPLLPRIASEALLPPSELAPAYGPQNADGPRHVEPFGWTCLRGRDSCRPPYGRNHRQGEAP